MKDKLRMVCSKESALSALSFPVLGALNQAGTKDLSQANPCSKSIIRVLAIIKMISICFEFTTSQTLLHI